jgi:recombination protein RecA
MSKKEDDIWAKLNKGLGSDIIKLGTDPVTSTVDVIPLPSPGINDAIGFGGIPIGLISQFHGPESSGKTLLAILAVIAAQKKFPDSDVVWLDAEYSLDTAWCKKLGVDLSRLRIVKENTADGLWRVMLGKKDPKTGKKTVPGVLDLVSDGSLKVSLIVLDSIAGMTPPIEEDRNFDEQEMAALARFLPKAMRQLQKGLQQAKVAMICINQAREKIGERVPMLTYPGGRAYRHQLSVALKVFASASKENHLLDSNEEKYGHKVTVTAEKTKGGPVGRKSEVWLDFRKGVIKLGEEVATLATAYGVVQRPNNVMWVYKDHKVKGQANFYALLDSDEKLRAEISREIEKARAAGVERNSEHGPEVDAGAPSAFADDGTDDLEIDGEDE